MFFKEALAVMYVGTYTNFSEKKSWTNSCCIFKGWDFNFGAELDRDLDTASSACTVQETTKFCIVIKLDVRTISTGRPQTLMHDLFVVANVLV